MIDLTKIIAEIEGLLKIHYHDMIPNYTSELENGCKVCVANNAILTAVAIIRRHQQDEKKVNLKCEGACIEHSGEVKRVEIYYRSIKWGEFNYCDKAIETDLKNGFKVKVLQGGKK